MMRLCRGVLLLLLGIPLVSCLREPPDRTNAVQVPLILVVLAAPALSHALRRRDRSVRVSVLVLQILAYLVYETGISIQTNIRIDLPLICASIALNAWIVFRSAVQVDAARAGRPTWATVVGVLGMISAVAGILGALFFFSRVVLIQSARESFEQMEATPQYFFHDDGARQAMHDRLAVPPWFAPFSVVVGLVGFVTSSVYLWGAVRFLQLKKNGPMLFMIGAASQAVVSASIATAGLVSSSARIREDLFPALVSLGINGVLLFVVQTRKAAL